MLSPLTQIPRFSDRARSSINFATQRRIATLTALDYVCLGRPEATLKTPEELTFTLATIVFDGDYKYISSSLASMYSQDYPHMEYIIIDNGSTGDIRSLVNEYAERDSRTKIIRLNYNYFQPELPDEDNPWPNLINAALFLSQGDIFFALSYDDKLSNNYASEMVELFRENTYCTSAAPAIISIDASGAINESRTIRYREANDRKTYIPGIHLARGVMNNAPVFISPGEVLAFKSDPAIQVGGVDVMNDITQIIRLAVVGESGFSPNATLYWRHHPEQTNKYLTRRGQIYYREYLNMASRYGLVKLYAENFTQKDAHLLEKFVVDLAINGGTLNCIQLSTREYGLLSGFRALRNAISQTPPSLWLPCSSAYFVSIYGSLKNTASRIYRTFNGRS